SGTLLPGTQGNAQGTQALAQALKLPIALTTGSEVRLRLIAVPPPPRPPPGNAVLHSPLGAIILQGALHVPVGTELSMAVEPALPTPAALPASSSSLPQLVLSVARSWPSLTDAIALLRQNSSNADALAV